MTDGQLKFLIVEALRPLLDAQGLTGYPIVEGFARTKQGREPQAVYYHMLDAPRRGWQRRSYRFDQQASTLERTESQVYEATFQVQGFAPASAAHTPEDVTKITQMLISSYGFIEPLALAGVTLQQPTGVRVLNFNNDLGQNEPNPSFDFTVSYNRDIIQSQAAITSTEFNTLRV